jgi:excisionase family DNA binding protein
MRMKKNKMKKGSTGGKYMSIPEIAAALGVNRSFVYKQVLRGEIKSIKIGKTYGIPRSYLTEIRGGAVGVEKKKQINRAVKKVIREYGELLIKLGRE